MMKHKGKTLLMSALLMTGSTFALAQPAAQQGQQQGQQQQYTPPAATQQDASDISDSQLALYGKVSKKIEDIRGDLQQEMGSVETAEEAQKLQNETMEDMVSAVESLGMTTDEYNQITTMLQSDPELRERFEDVM